MFLAFGEDGRTADGSQFAVTFEVPVGPVSACVNNALRDALVVEVKDLFAEVEALEECRPTRTGSKSVLVVGDRNALLAREDRCVALRCLVCFTALVLNRRVLRLGHIWKP